MVEADARLIAGLAKASAPVVHRLQLLLRLAIGEVGPTGPVSDRARTEAARLMRTPDLREALQQSPEQFSRVRELAQAAGLAAA